MSRHGLIPIEKNRNPSNSEAVYHKISDKENITFTNENQGKSWSAKRYMETIWKHKKGLQSYQPSGIGDPSSSILPVTTSQN